jgi:lipoprotein NlpD
MTFTDSKLIFILMLPAFLNACALQSNYTPVNVEPVTINPSPPPTKPNHPNIAKTELVFYVVKKDDTLYSIARLFKLDYRQLAHWNLIPQSFTIKVGQKLRLSDPAVKNKITQLEKLPTIAKTEEIKLRKGQQLPSVSTKQKIQDTSTPNRISSQKNISIPLNNKASLIHDQPNKADNANKPTEKRETSIEKKSNISIDNETMLKLSFQWPIKGKIVKVFSDASNKGIDIAGEMGQAVGAAEAGKVVYSGQGPIGYGNLLIIKHNDLFLSAYANNSQLLVTEGQTVKKGEVIANVGQAGSNNTSLHFEIRKNGKPVNPLDFLPGK